MGKGPTSEPQTCDLPSNMEFQPRELRKDYRIRILRIYRPNSTLERGSRVRGSVIGPFPMSPSS